MIFGSAFPLAVSSTATCAKRSSATIQSLLDEYATRFQSRSTCRLSSGHVRRAYGATLACFPAGSENYALLLAKLSLAQGLERVRETMRKILRRPLGSGPKMIESQNS